MRESDASDLQIIDVMTVQVVVYRVGEEVRAVARYRGGRGETAIGRARVSGTREAAVEAAVARALAGLARRARAVGS